MSALHTAQSNQPHLKTAGLSRECVRVLTVNISSNTCTVWYTIYGISTAYREEWNILLCWLYTFAMSPWECHLCVETCSIIYIYVTNGVSQIAFVGWYIDCSLTLHCFTVPLKLPHINIGPLLYMISPSLSHLVLPIVQCSAAVCMFVTCGIGRCDQFTGCAELRLDRCEYPYNGCYVLCWNETYAIVLYKQKTLLQIVPITTMTVGYTINIPADEYTAKWTALTNAATTVTLISLIWMFSKWTVQCVHFDNTQLNSDSTWLYSHNWMEETEVDIWMQKFVYSLQTCM